MADLDELLGISVPDDHSRQSRADRLAQTHVREATTPLRLLDLGCGLGRSRDMFAGIEPATIWIGVDIIGSPEVMARNAAVPGMVNFDGERLPFADESFDLVFSQQVLEHVRHPQQLLTEARRVIRDDGVFIGSTSHLEPYHSHSVWNFTPYGLKVIAEDSGFEVLELRPGIDSIALIQRAYTRDHETYNPYFSSTSPLNDDIDRQADERGSSARTRNLRKLAFCGHFVFTLRPARPDNDEPSMAHARETKALVRIASAGLSRIKRVGVASLTRPQ